MIVDTTPTGGTPPAAPPAPLPNNFRGSLDGAPATPAAAPAAADPPPAAPPPPAAAPAAAPARAAASDEPLAERLERARRKARADVLKELGVENPEVIKNERAELARLKAEKDKADRDKLTREQQLEADLKKEREQRAALEAKLAEAETGRVYEKQDAMILQIAGRHVDTDSAIKLKAARIAFAEYVESIPKSQVQRMNERDVDTFFRKFAKENPDFAKKGAPPPPQPPAAARKPITTSTQVAAKQGAPPPAPTSTDPSVNAQGKTFKPGQSNSMTRAEMNAELKKRGMRGWR